MSDRVAAVVVTYNRKDCLKNCIRSLVNQTRKVDRIYIIDNASSDGTEELVNNNYSNINELKYIKLETNIGGAGGFNKGLEIAYNNGCDFIWVMDDDGIPQNNCLEELLSVQRKTAGDYICSTVVSEEDGENLVFGLYDKLNKTRINTISELNTSSKDGYIDGCANPFNGLLLSRQLISQVGLPKEDLFIWGDEIEYELRVIKNGFKVYTATNAIHKHPINRMDTFKILFGKVNVSYVGENNLRSYCYFRNRAYIYKKYSLFTKLPIFYIKYVLFFISQKNIKGIKFFINASVDGLFENFSKHINYLNSR